MPLLPQLQDTVSQLAAMGSPPEGLSPAERRAWVHERIDAHFGAMSEDRAPVASEVDHGIPVDGAEILVRVYRPDASRPLRCYLHLHGGGFWLGTLDQSTSACRGIAADANCVVVDVDYRLAPEHKFPTAPEDCYAALLWVVAHADELGIDASRLAVGGGSAGGNLAAVVSLAVEDAEYAQRLREAGIPVEERCWEGQIHGSQGLAKVIPDEAAAYHHQIVAALRRAFGAA